MATTKLYYENAFLQDFTAAVESWGCKDGFAVVLTAPPSTPRAAASLPTTARWARPGCWTCRSMTASSPTCATASCPWARRSAAISTGRGASTSCSSTPGAYPLRPAVQHVPLRQRGLPHGRGRCHHRLQRRLHLGAGAGGGAPGQCLYLGGSPVHIWYPDPEELAALPYRSKKALTGSGAPDGVPRRGSVRLLRHTRTEQRTGGAGEAHRLSEIPRRRAAGAAVRPACVRLPLPLLGAVSPRRASPCPSSPPTSPRRESPPVRADGPQGEKPPGWRSSPSPASPPSTRARGTCCSSPIRWRATASAACATRCPKAPEAAAPCSPAQTARTATPSSARRTSPPLVKAMNQSLSGRGGGRNGFAQGSAACTAEAIRAFFAGI